MTAVATPARPGRRFLFSGTCYAPASGIQIGADHSIKGVAPSQWLGAAGLAVLVQAGGGAPAAPPVTFSGMLGNLVPVIGGNLLGGSVVVGLTYHVIYRRGSAS